MGNWGSTRFQPADSNALPKTKTRNRRSDSISSCDAEFTKTKKIQREPKDVEDFRHIAGYDDIVIFTYRELRLATKYFRHDLIIGEGGFGVVYRGVINENVRQGFEYTEVAVKVLCHDGLQGDREWLAEVNSLGKFNHPNLVKLIGYCCEDDHRLLVYEYMTSGSLEKHIFLPGVLPMPWPTRLTVALDAAKGLAFLHGAEIPIIYRDFKASNILLDKNYNAKLSDFGLAKEGPMGDQTHVSTRILGTYGYAAPEYVMTGHLTARSDVYGYGVVLLEMLIGKRTMDRSRPTQEHNLVEFARPLLIHNKKLKKIIDPRMDGQYSARSIRKVANLAYHCLSSNPKGRPTMSQVVEILQVVRNLPETATEDGTNFDNNGGSGEIVYEVRRVKSDRESVRERRRRRESK